MREPEQPDRFRSLASRPSRAPTCAGGVNAGCQERSELGASDWVDAG